jgi:hypothetical protein
MKKNIVIASLVILTIYARKQYYELLKGPHDGAYFMRLENTKDGIQYFIIGSLLLCLYNAKDSYTKVFIIIGSLFCFTFAGILQYDSFLPPEEVKNIRFFLNPYFTIFITTMYCLVIYFFFLCITKLFKR